MKGDINFYVAIKSVMLYARRYGKENGVVELLGPSQHVWSAVFAQNIGIYVLECRCRQTTRDSWKHALKRLHIYTNTASHAIKPYPYVQ